MSSNAVSLPAATLAPRPRWMRVAARIAVAVPLLAVACLATSYVWCDQERLDLTEDARKGVSGSFIRLGDGVVHYELTGPAAARTVVLVHGFSVPLFIWDPTRDALVAAGMRVLRYDLCGRGWSDRPDVAYDADLFDRQLGELLDALGIHDPVDVAGISMGGSIAVRFADRHAGRVRSLVLVDPAWQAPAPVDPWLRLPLLGEYVMDVKGAPAMAAGQLDDFRPPRATRTMSTGTGSRCAIADSVAPSSRRSGVARTIRTCATPTPASARASSPCSRVRAAHLTHFGIESGGSSSPGRPVA